MKLPLRDFSEVVSALRGPAEGGAGSEQRQTTRITVAASIRAHLLEAGMIKRSFSVLTRDISITGMGLLQTLPLPRGAEIVVVLPRSGKPLFVVATVTHCRTLADNILAVGVGFARLADDALGEQLHRNRADGLSQVKHSTSN